MLPTRRTWWPWLRRDPSREAEILLGILDFLTARIIRTYPRADQAVTLAADIREMLRLDPHV